MARFCSGGPEPRVALVLIFPASQLRGSLCYPIYSWPRVIGLITGRKLPVEKAISSRVSLDTAVPDGFDVLTARGTDQLKILIQLAA
jgi:(R,R)-butanediol dehydrogenase/meso-butanediol dehydrogenase/diacetyl reductase